MNHHQTRDAHPCKKCQTPIFPITFGEQIIRPPLCDACATSAEEDRLEDIAKQNARDAVRRILTRREIVKVMRLKRVPLLPPLQALVDDLHDESAARWAMLHGITGTGKTTMLQLFIQRLIEHHYQKPPSIIYTTELDMMTDLKSFEHTYERYAQVGVLIVDEVGLLKGTDFEFQQWLGIINHRYRYGMVTLFGSNLSPTNFAQHPSFGDRTHTRLLEMAGPGGIVEMTGDFKGGAS